MENSGECLVCGGDLKSAWLVFCARCDTPHHRDCFEYNTNCAVYACESRTYRPAPAAAAPGAPPLERLAVQSVRTDAGAAPRTQIVVDFDSGLERLARAALLCGLGLAAASPLFLAHDPVRMFDDPWLWMGLAMAAAGLVASVLLSDVLIVDPATRTIRLRRSVPGLAWSTPLYRYGAVRAVRMVTHAATFDGLQEGWHEYVRSWLELEMKSGARARFGDAHGTPAADARPDLERLGCRVAAELGVPFHLDQAETVAAGDSFGVTQAVRILLWSGALVVAVRWAMLLLSGHLPGVPVSSTIASIGLGVFLAHWWFIARPLGTFGRPRAEAFQRLKEGYRTSSRPGSAPGVVCALTAATVGLGVFAYSANATVDAARALIHYRPVPCTSVSATVIKRGNGKYARYDVFVQYSYRAQGVERRGSRIGLNELVYQFGSLEEARERGSELHPGTVVTGYYDPANPETCVLMLEWPWFHIVLMAIGLILLEVGVRFFTRLLTVATSREVLPVEGP